MVAREHFEVERVAKKYDRATGKFLIDIRYRTRVEVTPRTAAVAEAFGLDLGGWGEQVICDHAEMRIGPRDIVYITGPSGSGKSVLLRALEADLDPGETVNIADVPVDPDRPIIETVGATFQEGLGLLSTVGLNDAHLFLRRFAELSEGQKYRYRLARLAESGRQYWVMDEFCSALDRDTARIVAFNVQRLARGAGRAVLAATSHGDLLEDLRPSVHVRKGLGERVEVEYFPNEAARLCSVARDMAVEEGSREDYEELARFHYRGGRLPPPRRIFALRRRGTGETVGVIVYGYPSVITFGRTRALGRRIPLEELNRDFALITRVIVHPKYRSIGLGARLVRETLPLAGKPCVEAVAVMARYNPFFERAGMTKVAESVPDRSVVDAVERLRALGFNPVTLASEAANLERLRRLTGGEAEAVTDALLRVSAAYYKRLRGSAKAYVARDEFRDFLRGASPEALARVLRRLAVLAQTKAYLLWRSPTYLERI